MRIHVLNFLTNETLAFYFRQKNNVTCAKWKISPFVLILLCAKEKKKRNLTLSLTESKNLFGQSYEKMDKLWPKLWAAKNTGSQHITEISLLSTEMGNHLVLLAILDLCARISKAE